MMEILSPIKNFPRKVFQSWYFRLNRGYFYVLAIGQRHFCLLVKTKKPNQHLVGLVLNTSLGIHLLLKMLLPCVQISRKGPSGLC